MQTTTHPQPAQPAVTTPQRAPSRSHMTATGGIDLREEAATPQRRNARRRSSAANPMPCRNPLALALAAALVFGLAGCERSPAIQKAPAAAQAEAKLPADSWFPLKVGDKAIQAQLAINDAERARGLMGRTALATDHGMLFVFDSGAHRSFWMENTPLPLDIGYFDNEGILREVYPMYPFDRSSVPSRRGDIRYALEMTQGWFTQNNVRPGAQLDLPALQNALERRAH